MISNVRRAGAVVIACVLFGAAWAQDAEPDAFWTEFQTALAQARALESVAMETALVRMALAARPDAAARIRALLGEDPAAAVLALVAEPPAPEDPSAEPADGAPETVIAAATAPRPLWAVPVRNWTGALRGGLEVESGDNREREFTAELDIERQTGLWAHHLIASGDLTIANDATAEQVIQGRYEVGRQITEKISLPLSVYGEQDRFSGFDYRAAFGFGAAYQVFDGPRLAWRVSGGPSVRFDQIDENDDLQIYPIGVLRTDALWRINDSVRVGNITEGSFGRRNRFEILSFLETDIIRRLALRFAFEIDAETDTPDAGEPIDTTTTVTAVYRLGGGE